MKNNQIQRQFPVLFAENAQPLNIAKEIPLDQPAWGRMGLRVGSPPENFVPTEAGGANVWGADVNKILNMLSLSARQVECGLILPFDQNYANAIGGYPQGAQVAKNDNSGQVYYSLLDGNTVDPATDNGSHWVNVSQTILNQLNNQMAQIESDIGNAQKQLNDQISQTKSAFDNELHTFNDTINQTITTFKQETQFPNSLQQNGWQSFPGGLIIQWGHVPWINGQYDYPLPIYFPNQFLSAQATNENTDDVRDIPFVNILDNGHIRVSDTDPDGWSGHGTMFWFAIGY